VESRKAPKRVLRPVARANAPSRKSIDPESSTKKPPKKNRPVDNTQATPKAVKKPKTVKALGLIPVLASNIVGNLLIRCARV